MKHWIFCLSLLVIQITWANEQPKFSVWTVERNTVTQPLYFAGVVQPIRSVIVASPVEGVVKHIGFVYGKPIKKDDVLMRVSSQQVKKDYRSALSSYLDAKEKFYNIQAQFEGVQQLWDLGIIPKNEYETSKSSLSHANVTYLQSLHSLNEVLESQKQTDEKEALTRLEISDVRAVDSALRRDNDERVITAPESGIALLPPASKQGVEAIEQGMAVAAGDPLLTIADFSGLAFLIQVTEVDISQIELEQAVHITGVAFPGIELKGEVTHIDVQASSQGSGLPSFTVKIEVPKITQAQQQVIKVGMSARMQIDVALPGAISVPIGAVFEHQGQPAVMRVGDDGALVPQPIKPGKTSQDRVIVYEGLEEGDRIALPD